MIASPPITITNPINPTNITDIDIVDTIQRNPNKTMIIPKKYPAILLIRPMSKCLTFQF